MSDQNAALAKKATEVNSTTQKGLKRPPDCTVQRNKVKKKKEVPSNENFCTVQSGDDGHTYKRKTDDVVHPNLHQDCKDMSASPALIPAVTEGSLSQAKDDESKQMHVESSNVPVSKHRSLKDSLYVVEHAYSSGNGLPYAPEDCPSPGDVWTWHVGERRTCDGFWQDRSLHPPCRLLKDLPPPGSIQSLMANNMSFRDRDSLALYLLHIYVTLNGACAGLDEFFASFMWKIPCTNAAKEYMASPDFSEDWKEDCGKSVEEVKAVFGTHIDEMKDNFLKYDALFRTLVVEMNGEIKEKEDQITTLSAEIADIEKKHKEAKDSWAIERETLNADLSKARVTIEIMEGQLERAYARNGNLVKEMEQVKVNAQRSSIKSLDARKGLAQAKSTIKEMESLKEKAHKAAVLETEAERSTAGIRNQDVSTRSR